MKTVAIRWLIGAVVVGAIVTSQLWMALSSNSSPITPTPLPELVVPEYATSEYILVQAAKQQLGINGHIMPCGTQELSLCEDFTTASFEGKEFLFTAFGSDAVVGYFVPQTTVKRIDAQEGAGQKCTFMGISVDSEGLLVTYATSTLNTAFLKACEQRFSNVFVVTKKLGQSGWVITVEKTAAAFEVLSYDEVYRRYYSNEYHGG